MHVQELCRCHNPSSQMKSNPDSKPKVKLGGLPKHISIQLLWKRIYLPSDLHLMEVLHNPCDPWFLVWLATCVSFSTLCKSSRGLCYANWRLEPWQTSRVDLSWLCIRGGGVILGYSPPAENQTQRRASRLGLGLSSLVCASCAPKDCIQSVSNAQVPEPPWPWLLSTGTVQAAATSLYYLHLHLLQAGLEEELLQARSINQSQLASKRTPEMIANRISIVKENNFPPAHKTHVHT